MGVEDVESLANAKTLIEASLKHDCYHLLSANWLAYLGIVMNVIRRPLAKAMHLFVISDFRNRYISGIAIRLHANTRSGPLQYSLQALVETSITGSIVGIPYRSQIVVSHSDGIQIVLRELTKDLPIGYPDDLEVAGAVERELNGAVLRRGEDGGSVGLFELFG